MDNRFISINKLYIKLDKKIILEAKDIKLNLSKTQEDDTKTQIDIEDIQKSTFKYLAKLNVINEIFDTITIENLYFNNTNTNIFFNNDNFKLENELVNIDLDIKKDKNILYIKSNKLYFKQEKINIDINSAINTRLQSYSLDIIAQSDYFSTKAQIKKQSYNTNLKIKQLIVTDIKKFQDKILSDMKIPQAVSEWVFDRAVGKKYTLNDFSINFNSRKPFNTNLINLKVLVENVGVRFNDKAKKALIDKVTVEIKNNNVIINYDNGIYNNTKLLAGGVDILNALTGKNIIVKVRLSGENLNLDGDVTDVLEAYDINTGIKITDMISKTKLEIIIDTALHKIDTILDVKAQKAKIPLLDLNLKNIEAKIKNNHLFVKADANYDNVNSNIEGDFSFADKKAIFHLKDTIATINDKKKINIKNLNLELDYNQDVKININELKTKISISKSIKVDIENISLLSPYSKLLSSLNVKNAKLKIDYYQNAYEIQIDNLELEDGFLFLNDKPYKSQNITIHYSDKFLNIADYEKNIFINKNQDGKLEGIIKNIQIKENEKLENFINTIKSESDKTKTSNSSLKIESIKCDNIQLMPKDNPSYIILKNLTLKKDDKVYLDTDIFIPNKQELQAKIKAMQNQDPNNEGLNIKISNITPDLINLLLKKETFQNGNFELNIIGKNFEKYNGSFKMSKTLLKGYKTYQRIITYINAVPNLLVFKGSDLQEKGFIVNNGTIDFVMQDDIYVFTNIDLNGSNLDIKGSGVYDKKYQQINMILDLITLKPISSIISNTPIISQIVMGKNKQISTRLTIQGHIDDVKVSSNLASQTIMTPFNIIKNTVTLPFNIFSK